MTLTEQSAADAQAVIDAQAALDAVVAKAAASASALAAVQPHLSLWQEVEAEAAKLDDGMQAEFATIIAHARALFNA
jgi:hypothetical protein